LLRTRKICAAERTCKEQENETTFNQSQNTSPWDARLSVPALMEVIGSKAPTDSKHLEEAHRLGQSQPQIEAGWSMGQEEPCQEGLGGVGC